MPLVYYFYYILFGVLILLHYLCAQITNKHADKEGAVRHLCLTQYIIHCKCKTVFLFRQRNNKQNNNQSNNTMQKELISTNNERNMDYVEERLLMEHDLLTIEVDEFNDMLEMADGKSLKELCSHLRYRTQLMRDDVLGMLYAYVDGGRSLTALAGRAYEAQEERRHLIDWLERNVKNPEKHVECIREEARYFSALMANILRHVAPGNDYSEMMAAAEKA